MPHSACPLNRGLPRISFPSWMAGTDGLPLKLFASHRDIGIRAIVSMIRECRNTVSNAFPIAAGHFGETNNCSNTQISRSSSVQRFAKMMSARMNGAVGRIALTVFASIEVIASSPNASSVRLDAVRGDTGCSELGPGATNDVGCRLRVA